VNTTGSFAAAAFYLGVAALCAGAISGARSTVERRPGRLTIPLLILGAIGIIAALVAYAHGGRQVLPF
jgi:uncharacterized membrane protein HdeD (DUF308 family)